VIVRTPANSYSEALAFRQPFAARGKLLAINATVATASPVP
jgi:hypothetical protein